LIFNTR